MYSYEMENRLLSNLSYFPIFLPGDSNPVRFVEEFKRLCKLFDVHGPLKKELFVKSVISRSEWLDHPNSHIANFRELTSRFLTTSWSDDVQRDTLSRFYEFTFDRSCFVTFQEQLVRWYTHLTTLTHIPTVSEQEATRILHTKLVEQGLVVEPSDTFDQLLDSTFSCVQFFRCQGEDDSCLTQFIQNERMSAIRISIERHCRDFFSRVDQVREPVRIGDHDPPLLEEQTSDSDSSSHDALYINDRAIRVDEPRKVPEFRLGQDDEVEASSCLSSDRLQSELLDILSVIDRVNVPKFQGADTDDSPEARDERRVTDLIVASTIPDTEFAVPSPDEPLAIFEDSIHQLEPPISVDTTVEELDWFVTLFVAFIAELLARSSSWLAAFRIYFGWRLWGQAHSKKPQTRLSIRNDVGDNDSLIARRVYPIITYLLYLSPFRKKSGNESSYRRNRDRRNESCSVCAGRCQRIACKVLCVYDVVRKRLLSSISSSQLCVLHEHTSFFPALYASKEYG